VSTPHTGSTPSAGPAGAGGLGGGFGGGAGGARFGSGTGTAPTGTAPIRPSGTTGGSATRGAFPGGGAGVGGFGGGGASVSTALDTLLAKVDSSYTWAAATDSSGTAAPLELATGKAVMAIGGFNGSDNAITLARFKQLVAAGKIRYYVGGGMGGNGGGSNSEIASWVASTFTSATVGGTTVYDLASPS
jgi:hypothetical protein